MKLTEQQKTEKLARSNIKKLVNRVSSEFAFKKWRDYHSYLHSMGFDKAYIDMQANIELNRQQLDELLNKYEDEAIRKLGRPLEITPFSGRLPDGANKISKEDVLSKQADKAAEIAAEAEQKFTEKNNYGLSKSSKETITLFWFQKKATAELLKGFDL